MGNEIHISKSYAQTYKVNILNKDTKICLLLLFLRVTYKLVEIFILIGQLLIVS